jgi:ribosomal protein S6E (S10)
MKLKYILLLTISFSMNMEMTAQKPNRYKLKPGDKFTLTSEIVQAMKQDIMGQKQEINQTISSVDEMEVVSFENGVYRIKSTGISRKVSMSGLTEIDLDSEADGDGNLAMKVLVNKSFYILMDKYGEIKRLEGFEAYKQQISDELDDTILAGQKEGVLGALDEETVSTTLESALHIYSPEKRKTWHDEYTVVVSNLPVSVSTDFVRKGSKKILADGTLNISGKVEIQGSPVDADMTGTQQSTYLLDKKTGLPKLVEVNQQMSGEMVIQTITVPMTMTTYTKTAFTW